MSLRLLLVGSFAYLLVLMLVALEVPLGLNVSRRVDAEVRSQAAGQAHVVATSAAGRLGNRRELVRLARTVSGQLGARVIVVGRKGRLLADSAGPGLGAADYAGRPEIAAALAGRPAQGTRHSSTLNADLLYTAVPVTNGGRTVGAIRITQSVGSIHSRVRRDIAALVGIGALALLVGLALAWFLAGWLSRPLRALAATARRVGAGDLDSRADPTGSREQREVVRAFNEMAERLSQSLAAQREFVANASHQLRTPLTGLRLRLEAAGLKADDPELENDLAAAEDEVQRLAGLLNALLALAREGQSRPAASPILLARLATDAESRWQGQAAREGRRLVVSGDPDTCVRAAEDDLAIILDNLIENGLVYSPPGTPVRLEWGSRNGSGYVAVLDEGPGISPADQAQVFDRFYRGRNGPGRPPGSGLGLAIVKTLARRWGGTATIASRSEGGARAEVVLPLADDEALPVPNLELDELLSGRR